MSNNKKDIVAGAVLTAAAFEGFEALRIIVAKWADPEAMPEVKAYLTENFEILRTNFTK